MVISESNIIVRYHSNVDELIAKTNAAATAAKRFEDGLDSTIDESKQLEAQNKKTGSSFGGLRSIISGVAAGFAAVGVAQLTRDLLALSSTIESSINKNAIVFGDTLDRVTASAEKNATEMGLTTGEYVSAAASIADLLIPMGFVREEAANISTNLVDLSGALSEWSGGQISSTEVTKILSSALLGEREQLKSLGIAISEADVSARLAEKGLSKLTGASLEQAKAAATLELITEKSVDAQNSYAKNTDGLVRSQARLAAIVGTVREEIGVALIPVFARLLQAVTPAVKFLGENAPAAIKFLFNAIAPLVQAVGRLFDKFTGGTSAIGFIETAFRALGSAITIVSGAITFAIDAISFLIDNIPFLQKGITVVSQSVQGLAMIFADLPAIFAGVVEAVKQAASNISDFFSFTALRARILLADIEGLFDDAAKARAESLRSQLAREQIGGRTVAQAFRDGFNSVKAIEVKAGDKKTAEAFGKFGAESGKAFGNGLTDEQKKANEKAAADRKKALEQQLKDEAEAAKKISDLRIEAIDDESERKIERIQEDARIEIAAAKGTAEQIEIQRQLIAKAAIKEIDKIRAEAESAKAIEVKIQTVEEKRFNVKSSERDGLITGDEARIEEQKLTLETLRIQLENAGDDRIKIMQQVVEAEIALEQLIVDEKKKKLQEAIDDRIKLLEEERLAVKEQLRDGLIDAEDAALKEQEINIKSLKVQLDAAEVGSIDYIKIKQQIADAETAIEKDTTAKVKAEQEERRKAVVEAAQSVISIAKQIADARIAQLDREIAAQQGRVDSALQTIEQGNTEQIQMEEDRLARLNEARQEAVEKQRIINAIEIAANNALAISQGIVAVTSAFAKGSFVEGIATSIALAATLAGTVLSVRNALSGVGSFAKGTERLTMKDGKPTTGTGMLIEAHAGERILTAKQNKEIGGLSNEKAVELIKKGKQFELATPYQNMRAIASNNQQQSTALVAVAGAKANEVKQMQLEIGGLQKTMQSVDNSLSVIGKQIKNMKNEVHITEDGIYSIHQKHESRIAEKKHALR